MQSNIYKLVYCSRNRIEGTPQEVAAELDQILAAARVNNGKAGVTGALLYSAGSFAQVLEGPVAAVAAIFEKVQRDFRHGEVTVLYNGPADARRFPEWSMAFAGTSANRAPEQADHAFEAAFAQADDAAEKILSILQQIVVQENDWILDGAA